MKTYNNYKHIDGYKLRSKNSHVNLRIDVLWENTAQIICKNVKKTN